MDLPNPEDFKNVLLVIPPASVIARDRDLPAMIRMAAADIAGDEYSTVGSILSGMCAKDIAILLGAWMRTLAATKDAFEEEEERSVEENDTFKVMPNGDDAFMFLLFTMLVARAEMGELRADPLIGGIQAELMASFMGAVLMTKRDQNVFLDLTKLSLDVEFLNRNFDSIIRTDNFKSMASVNEVKQNWFKLRSSRHVEMIKHGNALKNDLSPSPLMKVGSKSKAKGRSKGLSLKDTIDNLSSLAGKLSNASITGVVPEPDSKPEIEPSPKTGSLSEMEERMRKRLFGG